MAARPYRSIARPADLVVLTFPFPYRYCETQTNPAGMRMILTVLTVRRNSLLERLFLPFVKLDRVFFQDTVSAYGYERY